MKDNNAKGHMIYITWEEEDDISSSSSSSSSNDECENLWLMTHKKSENSEVCSCDTEFKHSYKQLLKYFKEKHAHTLSFFKKIYFHKNLF